MKTPVKVSAEEYALVKKLCARHGWPEEDALAHMITRDGLSYEEVEEIQQVFGPNSPPVEADIDPATAQDIVEAFRAMLNN